jgi:hypothetical protein
MSLETSTCCTCGYTWVTGRGGSHHCSEYLLLKLKKYEDAQPPDEAAAALLEIAAAAKAWHRSSVKGTNRLKKAVKAWIAIGG